MRHVRALIVVGLAACGGPPVGVVAPAPGKAVVVEAKPPSSEKPFAPLDLMATLRAADADGTFIGPVAVRLEQGGAEFASIDTANVPARVVEKTGKRVRVAVRLDHVRFGAWIDAFGVLAAIAHDTPVSEWQGGGGRDFTAGEADPMAIELRAGAHVRRLEHDKSGWTRVRYDGALEVNGWVPDGELVDDSPARQLFGRVPSGAQTLMLMHGAAFKTKPEWAARELAVLATGYLVDVVKQLDTDWYDVKYADDDVRLHGVVSRFAPPSRVHRPKDREDAVAAVEPIVTDTTAQDGTCLYAREDGEPIGFLVGQQEVQLVDAARGWYTLYVATPWARVAFFAHGPSRAMLGRCAAP